MALPGYAQRYEGGKGVGREIHFRNREWAVFQAATSMDLRTRARLEMLMQFYCDHGPVDMHEKMFKFLEHFEADRKQIRLEEFKAGAVRLFGFAARHANATVFFVTGIDVAKKQRRADRTLLDRAGKEAIRIAGLID